MSISVCILYTPLLVVYKSHYIIILNQYIFYTAGNSDNSDGLSDDSMDNSAADHELQDTTDCMEDEVYDGEVWEGVNNSDIEGDIQEFTYMFPRMSIPCIRVLMLISIVTKLQEL